MGRIRGIAVVALGLCGCPDEVAGTGDGGGTTTGATSSDTTGAATDTTGTAANTEVSSASSSDTSSSADASSSSSGGDSSTSDASSGSSGSTTGSDPSSSESSGAAPGCGDGNIDPGEDCDDAGASASCDADCTSPSCGDGELNPAAAEDCDDGDAIDGNGCDADCTPTRAVAVVAGGQHTCVRLDTGLVRCWGASGLGQLGLGTTASIGDDEPASAAEPLAFDASALQIDAGYFHSCARQPGGEVRCWGDGQYAQLGRGNGDTSPLGDDETMGGTAAIELGGGVAQVATGYFHSCALLQDQSVRCWGAGTDGQLGYGNTLSVGDDESPASIGPVALGGDAKQLTAGFFHSCALIAGGEVRCWGGNPDGQLGYGNTVTIGDTESPDAVGPIDLGGVAIDVVAGGRHTCALLEGGEVRCWGLGGSGQLGNATGASIGDDEVPAAMPVVDVGGTVVQLAAGFYYTCALLDSAEVRCWGLAAFGGLGYGDTANIGDDEPPSAVGVVDVGGDVVQIAAKNDHTCALLDTGSVRCWGLGADGRLGYGDTETRGDDEPPSAMGDVPFY